MVCPMKVTRLMLACTKPNSEIYDGTTTITYKAAPEKLNEQVIGISLKWN